MKKTLLFSLFCGQKKEKNYDWACKLFEINIWVYRLKKREDIKIDKIEDLKDYKITVWRNDFRHLFLEQNLGDMQ